MSGSHPLLQVHRVINELRIALVLSHHDGNTALTDHRNLLHYFLFKTSDLGNTPSALDAQGRTIWIVDAHRGDGKPFVVHADEMLTAFLELEAALTRPAVGAQ